jgi:hypothetical protein
LRYFGAIVTINGREKTEAVMATHLVDGAALNCLLADDLDGFLRHRERTIRRRIGALVPSRDQSPGVEDTSTEFE